MVIHNALTLTPLPGIPLVRPGDDLARLILDALDRAGLALVNGDILVIAQKIISKSEDRFVNLATVTPSRRAMDIAMAVEKDPRLIELILRESSEVLRTRPGVIIVVHRLGFVCANAGIDHSNVLGDAGGEDWVLLLPEDPDGSAQILRNRLEMATGTRLGVLIIDSHGRAWRMGITGTTIGISGMPAIADLRGQPDLFGYTLRVTQVAAADELAAGASLMMGQADEGSPVIHVRGFPYALRESSLEELIRPKDQDLFR